MRRKYRNIPSGGYASKQEASRGRDLTALEAAGTISKLRRQVKYELIPQQDGEWACCYVADFVYIEGGHTIVEDVKGVRTPLYVVKRKLMLWVYGIRVREIPAYYTGSAILRRARKTT